MFDLKTRILVVDDMMTMRKVVKKALTEIGYTDLIDANDGALGWEALNNSTAPVGLIISDWNMPNCTGLDLLKRVRGSGQFKNMPFILLTAEAEASQIAEAVGVGVNGYVVKPFEVVTLKTQLETVYKKLHL